MALIHAVITYKENTLVTEFPKDYLKIYEELCSIGFCKAPERILLTDNEGDDIRVKLYADSDIGNHLLFLLCENSTLVDANTADGDLFVSFWNSSDSYFLCAEDELDDCIKEARGMQLGGM